MSKTTAAPVPLIFGAASVMTGGAFSTNEAIGQLFTALQELDITHVDSAQLYGDCEVLLGQASVSSRPFTLDSKSPGGWVPGSLEPAKLTADFHKTLHNLGVSKLDTFFIHGPDSSLPLAPALDALDALHRAGHFKRLGLSNFRAAEVEEAHALCTARGWIRPSVYQGNYSAFARRQESELFPTLRRLGMSFSAYSPLAGGFLARRSAAELAAPESGGRFAVDPADPEGKKGGLGLYRELYSSKPKLIEALGQWGALADAAGCSCPAEMAYRWIVWNSPLDANQGDRVVVGASRVEQLKKTKEWLARGGLDGDTCTKINALWKKIEEHAPLDNLHKNK